MDSVDGYRDRLEEIHELFPFEAPPGVVKAKLFLFLSASRESARGALELR